MSVAEDFASWCVIKWLTGERTLDNKFNRQAIDFLRQYGIYIRNPTGGYKTDAMFHKIDSEVSGIPEPVAPEPVRHTTHWIRDASLSQLRRAQLILYYEWGFTEREIGDVFGMHNTQVSQTLKQAKLDLKITPTKT